MEGAAIKCAECPKCHLRYVLKQDSQWIGRVADGNAHRLFCLCGEESWFDRAKLKRYVVSVAVFRRGYGSADEVQLFEGHEGER